MTTYAIIGALFWLCIISGIVSSLYDHKWGEFKDLLVGSLFFPCVILVFLVISFVLGLLNSNYALSELTFSSLFDKGHIFILLPSIVLAAVILIPVFHMMEWLFPDEHHHSGRQKH